MTALREITTVDELKDVIAENDTVLIDFWASWCGPCRTFAPIFEKAAEANDDALFVKVDTEAAPELSGALGIMSIPTLMVFREQVLVYNQAGALPAAALDDLLAQAQGLDMEEVHRQVAASHDHDHEHDHQH